MKNLLRIFCIAIITTGCHPIVAGGGGFTPQQQLHNQNFNAQMMQGITNGFAQIQRDKEIGMAQIEARSQQRKMFNYLNNNPGTPVIVAPQMPATQVIGAPYGGYGYTPPPVYNPYRGY